MPFDITSLTSIAGTMSSLMIVGAFLMGVYNHFWAKPREKRRIKHEKEQQQKLTEALEPIHDFLKESGEDRKTINRRLDNHDIALQQTDKRLDNHFNHIVVLQTVTGLHEKSTVSEHHYKEEI